jgi:sterol desaturase/sphingolipid hydroxylase (fatty acid hydroxylase superfamily)
MESHVRLGTIGYYADFVIYPLLVLAVGAVALTHATLAGRVAWLGAAVSGIVAWTLLEYLMHRFVLHRVAYFHTLHDLHHAEPTAKMGTPSWVSLSFIVLGVFPPLWLALGWFAGSGVTTGIVIGYLWYISVHHIVHHWRVGHKSYFYAAKRYHAQHHYADTEANFGVTMPLWDWLFGSRVVLGKKQTSRH